jgi:hypothetical protein
MGRRAIALSTLVLALAAACGGSEEGATTTTSSLERATPSATSSSSTSTVKDSSTSTTPPTTWPTTPRPDWLGTRELPLRPDGLGEIQPTPPELVDRRFPTIYVLPPPETDEFSPEVEPVPDDVLERSTWKPGCPVGRDELRYVTVPFRGFDGLAHTGELLVHGDGVDAVLAGFRHLFERDFPIEEMRITRADELDAHPTGDGNNSGAFVCRPTVGSTSWSNHAYGLAVDINPFHNPYVRGDVVIPELASVYVDRADVRPGMLTAQDVAGFVDAGWSWGESFGDPMHLSSDGG